MNLKKFLPYESYTLATRLPVAEVEKRLSDNVEPRRILRALPFSRKNSKPYEGTITNGTFIISRIINYNNAFLPKITGNISSFIGQTHIAIKMALFRYVVFFLCLSICVVIVAGIGLLSAGNGKSVDAFELRSVPLYLIPFIMVPLFYTIFILVFKFESRKSKKFLADLFEAQEENSI